VSTVRRPTDAELGARPADRVAALVGLIGADAVVACCVALLRGADPEADVPLGWMGGRSAAGWTQDHWPRVWAARGLLHCFLPPAAPAVVDGLRDTSWRVREMCAKVVREHEVGAAAAALRRCTADEVPRVRAAAVRALARVGEAEDADAVRRCLDDPDTAVVSAAERALRDLSRRLDRVV
jgi:hypothetical protein